MDVQSRMFELAAQGFECSQILMQLFLDMDGKENPELLRAMGGLTRGMGRCGKTCGTLTGGVCVLGYFLSKGDAEEPEHPNSQEIIKKYVEWFEQNYGTDCKGIIDGDYSKTLSVCASIVEECFYKITELLEEYEILS